MCLFICQPTCLFVAACVCVCPPLCVESAYVTQHSAVNMDHLNSSCHRLGYVCEHQRAVLCPRSGNRSAIWALGVAGPRGAASARALQ